MNKVEFVIKSLGVSDGCYVIGTEASLESLLRLFTGLVPFALSQEQMTALTAMANNLLEAAEVSLAHAKDYPKAPPNSSGTQPSCYLDG